MNIDDFRCRYCDNLYHFLTEDGTPVCRLHIEQFARDAGADAYTFRPDMHELADGEMRRGAIARAARLVMTEEPVWVDFDDQGKDCCANLRQVRDFCPHGVERTFYNTGRVDILVKVPAAQFRAMTDEEREFGKAREPYRITIKEGVRV